MKIENPDLTWQWTGESVAYPDPPPGEDPAALGPAFQHWFPEAGPAVRGDTYPVTWADDDELYTSSGDPNWGLKPNGLDIEAFSGYPPTYRIRKINEMLDYDGSGGSGPKPAGMICVTGALYLAFQNLQGKKPPAHGTQSQHGSDASIVCSRDHGKTWFPRLADIKEPMFPGAVFGGPAFVNYGRNNAGARDGFVYAVSADQWDNGSRLRLGRVPSDRILERPAWEWVAGFDAGGDPRWTRELGAAEPIFCDERRVSLPEMVWLAPLKRYLLLTWRLHQDFSNEHGSELMIYAAHEPWGPFQRIHHESMWESREMNAYCPRIPLKWMRPCEDGITGWLQFSGSWRRNSPHYRSHVRPFRIRGPFGRASSRPHPPAPKA